MVRTKRLGLGTAAAAVIALVAAAVQAAPITFTTVSNNLGDSATATFDFSTANSFTLTLTNTSTITSIANVLDDFSFTLSPAPGSITQNSLSFASELNCTSGTCVTTTTPTPSWSTTLSGGNVSLVAGVGEHPFGIVDASINQACTGSCLDGLGNAEHNPYLLGPATFTFTLTGETSIPTISNVVFSFGTTPDFVNGTPGTPSNVPEPVSLAIFGTALVGFGLIRRRRNTA